MTAAPTRLPANHAISQTATAWLTPMRAWSGSTRVGETGAPGMSRQITGGPVMASAGEARRGREHQHAATAAVLEPPPVRHRKTCCVAFAEVVVVGVAAGGEVIEPHDRPTVLVRQRRRRWLRASRTRTLPVHGPKLRVIRTAAVDACQPNHSA